MSPLFLAARRFGGSPARLRENLPFGAEKFPIPKTEIGTSGWRSPAYMLPAVAPAEHLVFTGGA
jgi:hypothetical protein